jgi:hypothetical protein
MQVHPLGSETLCRQGGMGSDMEDRTSSLPSAETSDESRPGGLGGRGLFILAVAAFILFYLMYGLVTGNWTESDRTGQDCDTQVVEGTTTLATICSDRETGDVTTSYH